MSNLDRLRDLLLGYDDSPRDSTEDEMNVYFFLWNQGWRPAMFLDLARSIVMIRPARSDEERRVVEMAAAAIERAAKTSRRKAGGRPRAA